MIKGARTREDGPQKFSAPRPHERRHRVDTELAKNRSEQQGLVFAIPIATLESVVRMRWPVRTDAQLNTEVPDLLLRQLQRCTHLIAGDGVLTADFVDPCSKRRGQVGGNLEQLAGPIRHLLPGLVFGYFETRRDHVPYGTVPFVDHRRRVIRVERDLPHRAILLDSE